VYSGPVFFCRGLQEERSIMRSKISYKEKLGIEKSALVAAGLISERHAGITGIEFHMTYYKSGQNTVLMKRTLNFTPRDYADFNLKCTEYGCTDGGFNLGPVVADLVEHRKRSCKGKIFCRGTNYPRGHASIDYEVSIHYGKQER